MNPDPEERQLGEYRLQTLLAETPRTRTWLAQQVSVSRKVLVDELKPGQEHLQEEFLADVRAKAAVEHPLIGSVYEAVRDGGNCFFAHEWLPGATLEERRAACAPFKPVRVAHMLRRIAEANMQFEAAGQATEPISLRHLHLDDQGVLRLENLAISGERDPGRSCADIAHLGQEMPALVADSQPGSTRVATLLGWMRGEQLEQAMTWEGVRDVCNQIEQQLSEHTAQGPATQSGTLPKKPFPMVAIGLAGAVVAGVLVFLSMRNAPQPKEVPVKKAEVAETVLVPQGKYPTLDGTLENLRAFRISAQEVTIGQYKEFLSTLETLSTSHRERTFDHENQPPSKTSHEPDGWAAMYSAAKTGATWNGLKLSLDCPVVGVDWWDCAAYAEWKRAQLPTQEEWFAACSREMKSARELKPAGWIEVTARTDDRTPTGLIGMAGSVCEWTRRPAIDPTNPMGERKWVLIGGSHLKPGSNAMSREWVDDRSLRRPDLGFRIVLDAN